MLKLINTMQFISLFGSCITVLVLVIKPIRERLFGIKKYYEGMRCLLRGRMLSIYYRDKDTTRIRQYEYEDFLYCYKAYKELGGNSFIDKIYDEVRKWEVVS